MEIARHRVLPFAALAIAPLLLALSVSGAHAQDAREFPGAAMRFLNVELPQMENAIKERDRDYFEDAMSRMLDFSDQWGFKVRDNPQLNQMVAFYKTPAGQKFSTMQAEVLQASVPVVQAWSRKLSTDMAQRIKEEVAKKGQKL